MKLDYNSSSLIIAGGWNANIFSPAWLSKNFLDLDGDPNIEKENVVILVQMSDTHSVRVSPLTVSFKSRNFKVVFNEGRLQFLLDESQDFSILESSAIKIFEGAINTTVTGYKADFVFTQDSNIDDIIHLVGLNQITSREQFYKPFVSEQYTFTFNLDDIQTNISVEINPGNDVLHIRFNFHFNVEDFSQFKKCISENPMNNLLQKSVNILSENYALELEY